MPSPKILIVDDQNSSRIRIKYLLSSLSPRVTEAANGKEAYEILQSTQSFDLILTDFEMPKMNGHQLCKLVKKDNKLKGIPIIMISTFDSDSSLDKGFEAGASAYISKAALQDNLLPTVTDVLSKSAFWNSRKIMIVDDSIAIRKVLENTLICSGFQVVTAKNGREALDKLRKESIDLILSDIEMPQMDGFELCKKIKTDKRLSGIPLVIMSSRRIDRYIKKALHQGAAAFLPKPFHPDELNIIIDRVLSDQFQLILKEKENLTNERDLLLASIMSLANALEARDPYTNGHSESVAYIVTEIAGYIGKANADEIEKLNLGAKLHDIGKIGISDLILQKNGKLTDEEYSEIKKHPQIGDNILEPISSLADIIPIVLHHHERYDGKGYPHGLKGKDIPFWARMTAVADCYDAMTSDRPYRKGMPEEKALHIIKDVRNTQLCPECVDHFCNWVKEKGFPLREKKSKNN